MVDLNASPVEVAIVTGAGRGIGLEIGRVLASNGWATILVDIDGQLAEIAAAQLVSEGYVALGLAADISSEDQVRAVINRVLNEWQRIDILVNNAGICPLTPLHEISASEWDSVLAVNLKGAFLLSQAVAPTMLKQKNGRIINISSSAGQMGGLAVGLHYTASKAGLLGLTKGLARILAPFVQVNAIAPGTTESEMSAHVG